MKRTFLSIAAFLAVAASAHAQFIPPVKGSALSSATSLFATDTMPITQSVGTRKATLSQLKAFMSSDVINVVSGYGADPTGATDSCFAITSALAKVPTGASGLGGVVYFPQGTYVTSCWPTVTDKAIGIAGAANGPTQITFTSATNAGLKFDYPTTALVPQIKDISLITVPAQTSNPCISITRPPAAKTATSPGPLISNVNCAGVGTTYWQDGIVCSYCTFLTVARTHIIGGNVPGATVGTNNMNRGIYLNNSIDAKVYDLHVYFAKKGISVDTDSEGLKLDFSSFVMTDWGVYTEPTWTGPSLVVMNSHFNVTKGGIHIDGGTSTGQTSQGQIHDNLIYRWTAAAAEPWTGIECLNGVTFAGPTTYGCKDHVFHGNNIMAFKGFGGITGSANCFKLGSLAVNIAIHDNTCRDADYFLDAGSSTSPTITVYNNHGIGTGNVSWQRNQNPYAIWRNNDPAAFGTSDVVAITQGLNATNWGLGGANVTAFITNSSNPTTVTDAIGGWPGLVVNVRCNDTNTTISNGSGGTKFALSGGTPYVCPRVGATITFMYSDQWREIGRAG